MELLSDHDYRRLLDMVRECHGINKSCKFEDYLRRLVTALSELIPSTHVTYNEMNPSKGQSYNIANTHALSSVKAAEQWGHHMNEHPVLAHIAQTGDIQAARVSDFWGERRRNDKGLYRDFYHHYEIEDALCVGITVNRSVVIGIGWYRDIVFTDREKQIVDLLRPHIIQAWKNARLLNGLNSQLNRFNEGLDIAHIGLIACNDNGRVLQVTSLARKYLANYFNAPRNLDSQLPDQLLRWLKHHCAKLHGKQLPAIRLPLEKASADGCLTVRLMSNAGTHFFLLEETISNHALASLEHLPLTRRESETLHWVAQGKTNGEIATILGISILTVKKHIEHILHKLGVETRTAAAAMALQFPNRNR